MAPARRWQVVTEPTGWMSSVLATLTLAPGYIPAPSKPLAIDNKLYPYGATYTHKPMYICICIVTLLNLIRERL